MPRKSPKYPLESVRQVAKDGKVFCETKAESSRLSLGYSVEEVCACLTQLCEGEFHKSLTYIDPKAGSLHYDVYKTRYTPSHRHETDYLYVKFRVSRGICILVGSFKLV